MNTSLHIALCDSSPGDRKQMERLLSRESDRRVNTTGVFYIDTFGGVDSIVNAALVYDVYFLDSTDPLCDSYEIAKAVRNKGILSPIVFCISTVDYRQSGEILPNTVFLNKPIKVSDLTLVIDEIIHQKQESYIPTIELRNQYEAFYVREDEVAFFVNNGYTTDVHFADGTVRVATTFLDSLRRDLESFDSFKLINRNTIVNSRFVKELKLGKVIMNDGSELKANLLAAIKLKNRK